MSADATRTNGATPSGGVLVLDGEPALERVERGGARLVVADVEEGRLVTAGRVLDRLESGQSALAMPLPPGRTRLVLLPDEGARVRHVPLDRLADGAADGPVGTEVRRWILRLAALLPPAADHAARSLDPPTDEPAQVELNEGESLAIPAGRAVWVRVLRGRVTLPGTPRVPLVAGPDSFPLGAGMAVVAEEAAELEIRDQLADATQVERGLARLHGLVLERLARGAGGPGPDPVERRAERRRRERARTQAALEELAGVLVPGVVRPAGDDALARAFHAVVERLGLAWRPEDAGADAEAHVGPDGTPVDALARSAGVRLRRVTLRGRWWRRDVGSLLVFGREDGRPLALLAAPRGYELYDPGDESREGPAPGGGRRRVTRSVARELAREALMPYAPLPEGPLRLRDLVRFALRGRRRELRIALLTGLAATLLGMITPQVTAVLMDHAIPDADRRLLLELGAGLLAATLGATMFRLSQSLVLLRLGLASEAASQAALWDRLLRLRPAFLRGYSSGDLQSRTMAVHEIGRQATGVLLTSVFASSMALLNLFLLLYYSPRLTLVAVAVAGGAMAFVVAAGFVVQRLLRRLIEIDGRFFGLVVQLVDGVGKLRVAGAAERAFQHWAHRYAERLRLDDAITRWRDRVSIFARTLPGLSSGLLFLFAHDALVGSGGGSGLTLGTFLAFTVAFSVFLSGVTSLAEVVVSVLDLGARARRIQPLIEAEPEVASGRSAPGRLGGALALDGVDFRYAEAAPLVLRGVDVRVEPGEFVAIVGPSGSGKSTLLRLLLGFERPLTGHVTYDGKDLETLDVVAVRRQLGVVLQDGRLDAGSIHDNLACGAPLDMERAWAAAEAAGLAEEIREMPMGMHTVLGVGGGTISGGQRQRLLIARALARRPRVVLLDEATSSLDNRAQAVVARSLERLRVTRVAIAHRLSTIRRADRIYVLDAGRVVQVGRFDELLAQEDGLFAAMMRRQLA